MNQFYLGTRLYVFPASGGSARYQLERRYDVSNTSVSLGISCDVSANVLNRSVSLRYQLVRRYDVSNWLVLSTYQ